MLFSIGVTEDSASGRAARPGGTDCISSNPPPPGLDQLGVEVADRRGGPPQVE